MFCLRWTAVPLPSYALRRASNSYITLVSSSEFLLVSTKRADPALTVRALCCGSTHPAIRSRVRSAISNAHCGGASQIPLLHSPFRSILGVRILRFKHALLVRSANVIVSNVDSRKHGGKYQLTLAQILLTLLSAMFEHLLCGTLRGHRPSVSTFGRLN